MTVKLIWQVDNEEIAMLDCVPRLHERVTTSDGFSGRVIDVHWISGPGQIVVIRLL